MTCQAFKWFIVRSKWISLSVLGSPSSYLVSPSLVNSNAVRLRFYRDSWTTETWYKKAQSYFQYFSPVRIRYILFFVIRFIRLIKTSDGFAGFLIFFFLVEMTDKQQHFPKDVVMNLVLQTILYMTWLESISNHVMYKIVLCIYCLLFVINYKMFSKIRDSIQVGFSKPSILESLRIWPVTTFRNRTCFSGVIDFSNIIMMVKLQNTRQEKRKMRTIQKKKKTRHPPQILPPPRMV